MSLPGGGEPVAGQCTGQRTDRLAAVPAEGLGRRSGASRPGAGAARGRIRHEATDLATSLGADAYEQMYWREGINDVLRSRFARVRVRVAHRDYWRSPMRKPEWLLIEWPEGEREPLEYFLSTAPEQASIEQMVFVTKMRWRIERDYQELKQEFGFGHYEGRGWIGFHHHATLSIAAYGFLVAERLRTGRRTKKTPLNAGCLPYPRVTSPVAVLRA